MESTRHRPKLELRTGVQRQIGRRARSGPLFRLGARTGGFRRMGNFDRPPFGLLMRLRAIVSASETDLR